MLQLKIAGVEKAWAINICNVAHGIVTNLKKSFVAARL